MLKRLPIKQGLPMERSKWSFRKFVGRYGDLIQQLNMKSLWRMLNEILTLDQLQWLPTGKTFYQYYNLVTDSDHHQITNSLQWIICNVCGMPAGSAYPSGHLVPSPFLGLAYKYSNIVETIFPELAVSFSDFSSWMPLGTSSILLGVMTVGLVKWFYCFTGSQPSH